MVPTAGVFFIAFRCFRWCLPKIRPLDHVGLWGLTMVPSVFMKVAAFTFCTVTPVEFASPFSMPQAPEKKKLVTTTKQ